MLSWSAMAHLSQLVRFTWCSLEVCLGSLLLMLNALLGAVSQSHGPRPATGADYFQICLLGSFCCPKLQAHAFSSLSTLPGCPQAPAALYENHSLPLTCLRLCVLPVSLGAPSCWEARSHLLSSSGLSNHQAWGISFPQNYCSGWDPYHFFL